MTRERKYMNRLQKVYVGVDVSKDVLDLYIHPTMKFHQIDGSTSQIFMPVALWGIGDVADEAITRAKLGRVR